MAFTNIHLPCENCGSSDAKAVNDNGSTICFSCNHFTRGDGQMQAVELTEDVAPRPKQNFSSVENLLTTATYKGIPERCITQATAKFFGVLATPDKYYFSYHNPDDSTLPVAAKVRQIDKQFSVVGDWASVGLFGQHLFNGGGKFITIVEGEFDALAAYQMTGSKYPTVSIKSGAASALKDCKASYEFLDSFDSIVICFDGDEAGSKAAKEVAELFGGKSKVVKHPPHYKDACDYLKQNDTHAFTAAWWAAERFVPDGIINGASLWDEVNRPVEAASVMYPWDSLNKLTYGIREAELVTITAGSGLGKSQFVREIVWHIVKKSESNIGLLFLEENARKTALSLMSLSANKPLHIPTTESTQEERWDAFSKTLGTQRLFLFDHFGSTSVDNIISRVRYMAKALDCKFIFLDHVSIVVSAQGNGDERKALDEIMTRLRMLVQETNISLFVVSHLKRPDSKGHEEGAATSLSQLRGSGSIAQLSDMVIGLERNGQADDLIERNTTHVRVLKNRFAGITGRSGGLLYNSVSGRMTEIKEEVL
jgi:twinkle protein